jgi:hypothetical protein
VITYINVRRPPQAKKRYVPLGSIPCPQGNSITGEALDTANAAKYFIHEAHATPKLLTLVLNISLGYIKGNAACYTHINI